MNCSSNRQARSQPDETFVHPLTGLQAEPAVPVCSESIRCWWCCPCLPAFLDSQRVSVAHAERVAFTSPVVTVR